MNSDTKSGMRIIVWVLVALLCYVAAFVLTPPAWEQYKRIKEVEPGSVGSVAQADTPVAHSIQEMQQLDRFVVHMSKPREEPNIEFFTCQGKAYAILILDSGERVAAKVYVGAAHYIPQEARWHMPIGRCIPWDLTEEEQKDVLGQEVSLSTLDFYVDMEGNQRTALLSQDEFVRLFQFIASWSLILLTICIWCIIIILRKRKWEENQAKNDIELWIAATHALWGMDFARFIGAGRKKKEKDPIRIGGAPKSPKAEKIVRSVLSEQWDITNYTNLLETVSYMSEGEGFYRCETQSARAWQLCRSTSLLGMAYVAGWADRKDIMQRALKICLRIQKTFASWDELYVSFLDHYAIWRLSMDGMTAAAQTDIQHRVDIYWELKRRKNSPCKLPWNLQLKAQNRE